MTDYESVDDINARFIGFVILLCIVFFFVLRQIWPDVRWYFPPSIVIIFSIMFLYNFGKFIIWRSRYNSDHITVNGISGSIYGRPILITDPSRGEGFKWAVYNLGFSLLPPMRGKLGTLVIPWNPDSKTGRNYIDKTKVTPNFPYEFLPSPVSSFLRRNQDDYNIHKVYYGIYSENFLEKNPNISDYEALIEAKETRIEQLTSIVEGRFDKFEEIRNFASRMAGQGFSLRKLFGMGEKKSEEEGG